MNKRKIGAAGETAALNVYIRHGYCLLERNWRYKRFGEIDLILSYSDKAASGNDDFIVFCEVKLRNLNSIQTPVEAVGILKQNRIRKLAEIFINLNPQYQNLNVRFDIAEVYYNNSYISKIDILKEAF